MISVDNETPFYILLREQEGRCAVCKRSNEALLLDHDHLTGYVRGLLCQSCNSSEGALSSTIRELLDSYRANPPAGQRWLYVDAVRAERRTTRQGIDLRPDDRERIRRLELFCVKNQRIVGKKRGLSLYARAGFLLLEELIETDQSKAVELLKRVGL